MKLTDKDIQALSTFFYIFWAASALNPKNLRNEISLMKYVGLVAKKGKLALTPAGKRAITEARNATLNAWKE